MLEYQPVAISGAQGTEHIPFFSFAHGTSRVSLVTTVK